MTIKELRDLLNGPGMDRFLDKDVKVLLAEPSMGPRSFCIIKNASIGFDWDSGLLLSPESPIVNKSMEQEVYNKSYELIMMLATEGLTLKRQRYEHKKCLKILVKNGISFEKIEKYVSLFWRDKPIITRAEEVYNKE